MLFNGDHAGIIEVSGCRHAARRPVFWSLGGIIVAVRAADLQLAGYFPLFAASLVHQNLAIAICISYCSIPIGFSLQDEQGPSDRPGVLYTFVNRATDPGGIVLMDKSGKLGNKPLPQFGVGQCFCDQEPDGTGGLLCA